MLRRAIAVILDLLLSGKRAEAALAAGKKNSGTQLFPASSADSPTALIEWLRKVLRRFPYWTSGHLALGRASAAGGDMLTAHISALAVLKLSQHAETSLEAKHLLARCALAHGDTATARPLLDEVAASRSDNIALKEDLIACCMLQEEYETAEVILNSISEEQRSAQSRSLLLWLHQRRTAQASPEIK